MMREMRVSFEVQDPTGCRMAVEEAIATFLVEFELIQREPYSWGETRGSETVAKARLIAIRGCGLLWGKDEALRRMGAAWVEQLELDAAEAAEMEDAA